MSLQQDAPAEPLNQKPLCFICCGVFIRRALAHWRAKITLLHATIALLHAIANDHDRPRPFHHGV